MFAEAGAPTPPRLLGRLTGRRRLGRLPPLLLGEYSNAKRLRMATSSYRGSHPQSPLVPMSVFLACGARNS